MNVKADRRSLLKITFYVTTVLTFMFDINPTEGLRWVKTPSDITICPDEILHLTWEYATEENEDIRQFQWRFNSSTLIAYRGVGNGLYIDPKYDGRVKESGVTGILLKNITAKDKGIYSLYIIIAWKDTPVIHSMSLNVIDAEAVPIPQWCTCELLPISREWNGGRNISVVTDGCRLEINSSHCCIREPGNRCTAKNQQDLCHTFPEPNPQIDNVTPVRNSNQLTENDTQNGLVPEGPKYKDIEVNTVLLIALIAAILIAVFISVVLIVICICWYWRSPLCTNECQMTNTEPPGITEQDEGQGTHMRTDNDSIELPPYDGNQRREEEVIKIITDLLYIHKSQGILAEKATSQHRARESTWRDSQTYSDLTDNDSSYETPRYTENQRREEEDNESHEKPPYNDNQRGEEEDNDSHEKTSYNDNQRRDEEDLLLGEDRKACLDFVMMMDK